MIAGSTRSANTKPRPPKTSNIFGDTRPPNMNSMPLLPYSSTWLTPVAVAPSTVLPIGTNRISAPMATCVPSAANTTRGRIARRFIDSSHAMTSRPTMPPMLRRLSAMSPSAIISLSIQSGRASTPPRGNSAPGPSNEAPHHR